MKKAALLFTVLIVAMAIIISTAPNIKIAEAAETENTDYNLEQVNHTIQVLYNGYVLINDTVRINITGQGQALTDFLIGFPYEYSSHVLRCIAYNESDVFPVELDVPLENRVGFYGTKINFPRGAPRTFTIVFVLSNDLIKHNTTTYYTLNFPGFPSLTQSAISCNVSIILPKEASYTNGTVSNFDYCIENLPAFTYNASQVTFSLSGNKIQLASVEELKCEIRLNEFGETVGSDIYRVKNEAQIEASSIEVILPPNASNPTAQDQFGRKMADLILFDQNTNRYKVTFTSSLKADELTRFTVRYALPRVWITPKMTNNFALNISLFRYIDYYIEKTSVAFVLPEGARVLSFDGAPIGSAFSLTENVFQETVTINKQEMLSLDSFNVEISYEYNPLWLSFRPTLWIWALSLVGWAVAIVWQRFKAPAEIAAPTVAVSLRPENVKSFVDAYEEKRKIILEIKSLETKVQKGKIPRRRYKVQRKTFEIRLNTLSRNLTEIKDKMRATGGQYADLMRQLEIAETDINEIEANIKSIEARHSRGELSLEAYRKLLADYQRRKEKAETSINGILLRLREEIR